MADGPPVTDRLRAWGRGEGAALEAMVPVIGGELHRLARLRLHRAMDGVAS